MGQGPPAYKKHWEYFQIIDSWSHPWSVNSVGHCGALGSVAFTRALVKLRWKRLPGLPLLCGSVASPLCSTGMCEPIQGGERAEQGE